MGIPETEKSTESKSDQEKILFPTITSQTRMICNPENGDIWLGFNPARFNSRVMLAWAAFQIEASYAKMDDLIRSAQIRQQTKEKKSLAARTLDILTQGRA